jgi:hypothetical protein
MSPLTGPPRKGRIEVRPICIVAGSAHTGPFFDGGLLEEECLEGGFACQLGPNYLPLVYGTFCSEKHKNDFLLFEEGGYETSVGYSWVLVGS